MIMMLVILYSEFNRVEDYCLNPIQSDPMNIFLENFNLKWSVINFIDCVTPETFIYYQESWMLLIFTWIKMKFPLNHFPDILYSYFFVSMINLIDAMRSSIFFEVFILSKIKSNQFCHQNLYIHLFVSNLMIELPLYLLNKLGVIHRHSGSYYWKLIMNFNCIPMDS